MNNDPWLILTHQLPSKPSNIRVKIWRKLQLMGAVPIKNSIYALPNTPETREDFEWLRQEISQLRGEASIFLADSLSLAESREIVLMFQKAREKDFAPLIESAGNLHGRLEKMFRSGQPEEEQLDRLGKEWASHKKELEQLRKIDFFKAPGRAKAEALGASIEKLLERLKSASLKQSSKMTPAIDPKNLKDRTWVTRRSPGIDRLASAWLIRRRIDSRAQFKFVQEPYKPQTRQEIRFDMYEAEFTHLGEWCTFETLMHRLGLRETALRRIAEVVHDIDLKDGRFGALEAPGVARLVSGICELKKDDMGRLESGMTLFDALHASFNARMRR